MKRPSHPYYRDKDGVEWGDSSQGFVEAADLALESLAKFLGREGEYWEFVRFRKMVLLAMNDPNAPKVEYEEYLKSIPYWVKVMEESSFKVYQAGLDNGRSRTGRKSKKEKENPQN